MNTGERIGELAKQKGMNLRQLSIKAGVSYNTVYAIVKRNSKRVDVENLKRLADALDVPWYELYADSTEGQIQAIREEIKTQLEDAEKKSSEDSDFAALFKHPALYDLADQIIALEEERTILTMIQLKNYIPKGQKVPQYKAPTQEELDRRIRNCIAYALLDHDIKPSGYPELFKLGFPEGDATFLLNYDKNNIPGRGIKTEEIKKWQNMIHELNNGTGHKEV